MDEKNIWFFWNKDYKNMCPYAKRNVRAWHRRLSKYGWTIHVLNRLPFSAFNIANFLDVSDPEPFPRVFINGPSAAT
ncbi:hypothetical protein MAP00_003597 [Monascus purpureus]|nr:hypothetical protein MAP00_003597 [Monascus purpureus]